MKRVEEKQDLKHEDGYPAQRVASESFQIRRATAQDADIIALHRARMFQDMGDVSGDAFEILRIKARPQLEQWRKNIRLRHDARSNECQHGPMGCNSRKT